MELHISVLRARLGDCCRDMAQLQQTQERAGWPVPSAGWKVLEIQEVHRNLVRPCRESSL